MLNDAAGFQKVYLAVGTTDLRKGIDGLAAIVKFQFNLDPYDKNTLFLFCGRKPDRIKGLVWEGTDFCFSIKGSTSVPLSGRVQQMKPWK